MKDKYNILFTKDNRINANLLKNSCEALKKLNIEIYNEVVSHPVGETIAEKIYCLVNEIYEHPKCLACGKPTNFMGATKGGYTKHCCKTCISKSKETKAKKAINHPFTREEFKEKSRQTCLERYGVERYQQTQQFKDDKALWEKSFDMQAIKTKRDKTIKEKFNVDTYMQSNDFIEKSKKTCLEKYNSEYYGNSVAYKEKIVKIRKEENYDNFVKKLYTYRRLVLLATKEDYINGTNFKVKCLDCGKEFDTSGSNFQDVNFCPYCTSSVFQRSVMEFVSTLYKGDIKGNTRKVIAPLELDIYIPELKIAIECDGIYYHSEVSGNKDKNYHLNKTKLCEEKGIRLIHIFENEWVNKKEIVCDILKRIFNKIESKIYARQCSIKELTAKDVREFLDDNHLQGYKNSSKYIGLLYKDELVSCATLSNKNGIWELDRYCQKVGMSIYYSLSKLVAYCKKNYAIGMLYTFCDRRYFTASGYIASGFKVISVSPQNYFYFSYDMPYNLKSRIQFQKHKLKEKLEVYDDSISEWENMKNNNYDRIWDCGNIKLVQGFE